MQAGCGNISQYSLRNFQIALQNETTALLEAQKNLISLRSTLNLLMGVPDNSALWTIVEPAPYALYRADLNKNPVEEALENRYDLQAATYSIYKKAREGQQKQWWSYTDLRLGVSTEQEVEGVQVTGPVVALSLPLFNQGQGDRFRLLHELQQSQQHYEALRERIVVEVNETSDLNKALSTEYLLLKNEAIEPCKPRLMMLKPTTTSWRLAFTILIAEDGEVIQNHWRNQTGLCDKARC